MPVDPQLQPLLDLLASSGAPPITTLEPDAARALMAAMKRNARTERNPRRSCRVPVGHTPRKSARHTASASAAHPFSSAFSTFCTRRAWLAS